MEKSSGWTDEALLATLHRVAGPGSMESAISDEVLRSAANETRYSLAFFADPDSNVQLKPRLSGGRNGEGASERTGMSVAEYVRWRAGQDSGIGVSFDGSEEQRVGGSSM